MKCVSVNGATGFFQDAGPPPCADGSIVIYTNLDFRTLTASPLNLSLSDGGLVGAAIVGVWAIGYCIRALIRVLSSGDVENESH